jgi:hypothetical protein
MRLFEKNVFDAPIKKNTMKYSNIFYPKALKIYPNRDFWHSYKSSVNPARSVGSVAAAAGAWSSSEQFANLCPLKLVFKLKLIICMHTYVPAHVWQATKKNSFDLSDKRKYVPCLACDESNHSMYKWTLKPLKIMSCMWSNNRRLRTK